MEHEADLELAAACVAGDAAALAALDAGPLRDAAVHLKVLGFAAAAIDDVIQRARARLVVDDAGPAGLRAYRGRGPLAMFVRTTAVRIAIDDTRAAKPHVELDALFAAPSPDPELEYMRKLYAEHLVAAVRDAWDRIAPHERFLLSLRIYESMTVDDLARIYRIHRASAARRAASARAALIGETRARLRDRLQIGDSTLDSILRILTTSVQLQVDQAPDPAH